MCTGTHVKSVQYSSLIVYYVDDPGSIDVKDPPHFANTNRMLRTTQHIFLLNRCDRFIKIRSDLKVNNFVNFNNFYNLCLSTENKFIFASKKNHDWDLPFNMSDWVFGGTMNISRLYADKISLIPNSLGISYTKLLNDYVWGYKKKHFSPQFTTEQILGFQIFNNAEFNNSWSTFVKWKNLRKDFIIIDISDAGLYCDKHKKEKSINILKRFFPYFLYNILLNCLRKLV